MKEHFVIFALIFSCEEIVFLLYLFLSLNSAVSIIYFFAIFI